MLASNRFVTLLGMGGIGKSRLSMQLAADILDDFPDGVWFVELAALTDPSFGSAGGGLCDWESRKRQGDLVIGCTDEVCARSAIADHSRQLRAGDSRLR